MEQSSQFDYVSLWHSHSMTFGENYIHKQWMRKTTSHCVYIVYKYMFSVQCPYIIDIQIRLTTTTVHIFFIYICIILYETAHVCFFLLLPVHVFPLQFFLIVYDLWLLLFICFIHLRLRFIGLLWLRSSVGIFDTNFFAFHWYCSLRLCYILYSYIVRYITDIFQLVVDIENDSIFNFVTERFM